MKDLGSLKFALNNTYFTCPTLQLLTQQALGQEY